MIKIGITGANGFIGRSLLSRFAEIDDFIIEKISFPITDQLKFDFIFHCAGVNRPKENESFDQNREITANLVRFIDPKCHVIFMSSIQIFTDNEYALSKLDAEALIRKHNNYTIFRLPNMFGAGCRPFYNSVTATFCQQTISSEPHSIHNPDRLLKLLWIEDLVEECVKHLVTAQSTQQIRDFTDSTVIISVKELSETIQEIYSDLRNGYSQSREGSFRWKLETTLLSTVKAPLIRNLAPVIDERGMFCELLKTDIGQISYLKCDVGEERGLHYHRAKYERFFVLRGNGVIRSKDTNGEITEINVNENELAEITIIPHHTHSIKNGGENELAVLIWANEIYNTSTPDTYKKVI